MKKLTILLFLTILFSFAPASADEGASSSKRALIFVHGYTQSGEKMRSAAAPLAEALPDTDFFYPTAPDAAPSSGYQWFDIPAFGSRISEQALYKQMLSGALRNVHVIHELVEEIHRAENIEYQNIYVAGFSQGGLMAVLTVLTSPRRLGGAVSLSGVPLLPWIDFEMPGAAFSPKILLTEGDADTVIPAGSLYLTAETLQAAGLSPKTEVIGGMGHWMAPEALRKMVDFIR